MAVGMRQHGLPEHRHVQPAETCCHKRDRRPPDSAERSQERRRAGQDQQRSDSAGRCQVPDHQPGPGCHPATRERQHRALEGELRETDTSRDEALDADEGRKDAEGKRAAAHPRSARMAAPVSRLLGMKPATSAASICRP